MVSAKAKRQLAINLNCYTTIGRSREFGPAQHLGSSMRLAPLPKRVPACPNLSGLTPILTFIPSYRQTRRSGQKGAPVSPHRFMDRDHESSFRNLKLGTWTGTGAQSHRSC